jgi:hypothetical protein
MRQMSEMQVPFDFTQGRLSTPLRFAQNDNKDGARWIQSTSATTHHQDQQRDA